MTNLFGSPALINRGRPRTGPSSGVKLPTLRRVISAGAPVPASGDRAVHEHARRRACRSSRPTGRPRRCRSPPSAATRSWSETRHLTDQGRGVCVGRPVPGMEVRVIPITDEPIPTLDEATVPAAGRDRRDRGQRAGRDARRTSAARGDGAGEDRATRTGRLWHRMGDVGYLDEHGRLWFCGRKSHRVVTPHGTLFTDPVRGGVQHGHPACSARPWSASARRA